MNKKQIDIVPIDGDGYLPLVDFESWRVARLCYIDELLPDQIDTMQKHNMTDEIFILLEGEVILFLADGDEVPEKINAVKLEPNTLYNVKKGTFHTHTLTPNSRVIIIENADTCDENSPTVKLNKAQKDEIKSLSAKYIGKL